MKKIILSALLLFILACQVPQAKGILEGKVTIGPLCPVERIPPDPRCQPTQETFKAWPISITHEGDNVKIATVVPAVDGKFRIELPAGNYVVGPESQRLGKSTPSTVTIISGATTNMEIDIDTGIR